MKPPLVSILIPCHNAERWVGEAIESALAQTCKPKEVIVVDDGSSDDTWKIITSFGNHIKALYQENAGSNPTRNRLLAVAKAEWIQYLDADDYLLPGKVDGQLELINADPDVDVFYGPVTIEWQQAGRTESSLCEIPSPHDPWSQLALWQLPQTGAPLFRREALDDIGGWNEDQPCCQEHELYLRLLIAGKAFRYADAGGAIYRRFEGGTLSTNNMAKVWRERLKIEKRLEEHLLEKGSLTPKRQWAINQARLEIARNAWIDARAIAREAHAAISSSGATFSPAGDSGPAAYRFIYRLLGFEMAQHISGVSRALRKRLA